MTMMNEPRVPPQVAKRTPLQSSFCVGVMLAALALSCTAQPSDQALPPSATQSINQPTPPSDTTTAPIAARLQRLYPATRFGVVNPTSWPGVYEVLMGANVAYVDESGQYFLFGHLYDMKAQRDVTAERKEFARAGRLRVIATLRCNQRSPGQRRTGARHFQRS